MNIFQVLVFDSDIDEMQNFEVPWWLMREQDSQVLLGDLMVADVQMGDIFMEIFLDDQTESILGLQELLFFWVELLLVEIQPDFILPQQARQGLPDFLVEVQGQVQLPIPIESEMNSNNVEVVVLLFFEQAGSTDAYFCVPIVEEEVAFIDFLHPALSVRQFLLVFAITRNQHRIVFTDAVFRKVPSHVTMQKVDFFF